METVPDPANPSDPSPQPVAAVAATPPPASRSWVIRLLKMLQREPVLAVTLAYLSVSALGLWASAFFFGEFDIPILQYMQPSDFLVGGLRDPMYALLVAGSALSVWVLNWPDRLRARDPARFAEWRKTGLGRVFGRMGEVRRRPWSMTPESALAFGIVWTVMWIVAYYVINKAKDVRAGGGDHVQVTLAGASQALPGDARLLGTVGGLVFLWWPQTKQAEGIPIDSVSRLRSMPNGVGTAASPPARPTQAVPPTNASGAASAPPR